MTEAKISDYREFPTFNAFFTRELKAGARMSIAEENALISPVDGCVSECGYIQHDQLLQAKGAYFNLQDLCGGKTEVANYFKEGAFLTAYLSPRDYHRFHMPVSGKLQQMIYVPGKLFSVNPSSVQKIPGLFARNERVICIFETSFGKVALIAVGAMIVGSIVMKWHGSVRPASNKNHRITHWDYQDKRISLECCEEVGHFQLGSTVIILCEKNAVQWLDSLQSEKTLRVGEMIGFAK